MPEKAENKPGSMSVKAVKITCVVIAYWTISISMVFANKYLLGDRSSGKDVSLFLAWFQCAVTVCTVLGAYGIKKCLGFEVSDMLFSRRLICARQMLMLACTFVTMLTFNNLCLKHVGVAFFQVARSMTLIFTVLFSVTILKKSVSSRVVLCCATVAGGFILGVDQEKLAGTLSVQGVSYGLITSLFVALNGIFIKRALDVVDKDSVRLTLYNNMNAVVLFFPLMIATGQLQEVLQSDKMQDPYFWLFLTATGVLGFSMAWIGTLQIDLTSPVTHHISANFKAVLQTLIAVMYHHDTKTALWWFSIFMVVGGAFMYALVRIQEEKIASKHTDEDDLEKGLVAKPT